MLSYVLFLSVWKRAARHFCVCTHFLSWYKNETNSLTHSYTFTLLHTHTHTLWYSLSLSHSLSHTQSAIHGHFVRLNGNVSIQQFFGTLPALLSVGTFDADTKEMTWLILLTPVFRGLLAPYEVQHCCSKQAVQIVFVLSQNKVEENFIVASKIQ